jgi:nitroreductase
MLNWAVLAPSVLDTQPWRFRVKGNVARLYADRDRQLHTLDPEGRELVISCGAALMNLRLAARHFGFSTTFETFPNAANADLLAALRLGKPRPSVPGEEDLFRAIAHRRTERRPFAPVPVPAAVLRELREAARREYTHLHVFTEPQVKAAIAGHVAEAVRVQGADRAAWEEMATWFRADEDPRHDEAPDVEQSIPDLHAGRRLPPVPLAEALCGLVAGSPALAILATEEDDPEAWLAAGQALERVLLCATAYDLAASFLSPLIQVAPFRSRLTARVDGRYPQVVFRLGHPIQQGGTLHRRGSDAEQ